MQDNYIFPAIFSFYSDEDDHSIGITFPDLPGCVSCAKDIPEAIRMARNALGLHLFGMENDNDNIPAPSDILAIKHESNQAVILVDVFMPAIRDAVNNKAVNRTVTLPQWLWSASKAQDINFSQTLQDALMHKLGITREIKRKRKS